MIGAFVPLTDGPHYVGYVVEESGCWKWTGCEGAGGYGRWGRTTAHRALWLKSGRTIPGGWELDHLCRNPACINPAHLEPVTREENLRREAVAQSRDTCIRGHPLSVKRCATRNRKGCDTCRRDFDRRRAEQRRVYNREYHIRVRKAKRAQARNKGGET